VLIRFRASQILNWRTEGTWFRMACCLKWWGAQDGVGDARARALWDEWSRSSEDKFDPTSQEERWQRIVPDGGLTIGTIFAAAMEEGYVRGDALASDGREYRIERVRPVEADLAAPASGNNLPSEEKPIVELHGVGGWSLAFRHNWTYGTVARGCGAWQVAVAAGEVAGNSAESNEKCPMSRYGLSRPRLARPSRPP
jgi:hypothetical protein